MKKIEHKIIEGVECKHCSKCGEWKPLSEFRFDRSKWDGLRSMCKECNIVYFKQYRELNKDKAKKNFKKWREKHKDYFSKYNKEWKRKNPMLVAAHDRIHSHQQSDKLNNRGEGDITIEWYIENILKKSCVHCGETDWRKLGCNRLDNSKPHTMDNVECCCKKCNSILANKELKSKQIDQIDAVSGEIICSFKSAREASRILNVNQGNISACARGEKRIANGYIWKYPL